MMSTSSVMPKWAAVPSPLGPSTPRAWASSSASAAPYFRATRTSAGTSAMLPSIEYTPSTTIIEPLPEPFRSMRRSRLAEVAVVEALGLAVGHLGAVDDRGVVQLVEVDHLAAADEPGDQAEVGGVAGREDEAGFLAQELGQGVLELLVQVERAVQEPAAGAARAVAAEGPAGGLEHLRMVGQAEVVVRPQHDPLLAVDDDDGVLRFGNRIEVRIEAGGLQLARFGELAALVEQRDLLKLLSIHGASARSGGEERASHRFATEWLKLVNARG